MNDDKDLTRLFNAAVSFQQAFVQVLMENPQRAMALEDGMTEDLDRRSMDANLRLREALTDEVMIELATKGNLSHASDDLAHAVIDATEILTELALGSKAFSEDELASLIAEKDVSDEMGASFEAQNAPVLARIYAPRP